VRVIGDSVGVGMLILVKKPVQTTPDVAVAWQPYSLSLHMNEKTFDVMLLLISHQSTSMACLELRTLDSRSIRFVSGRY
jgi:hypothetical protein